MKKKVYNKPMLVSEEFVADIFCAACYSLACDHGVNNRLDENAPSSSDYYRHTKNSNGTGCGHAKNQRFRIGDNGEIEVVELNAPQTAPGEELPCKFVGSIPTNATGPFEVAWTTNFVNGNFRFTYTHKGTVMLEEGRTGNHS